MRIWSIHPKYLDTKGLVALWRETLLAKNVLENKTKGYRNHPQLDRFKKSVQPLDSINYYLSIVFDEASRRNYVFNKDKFFSVPEIKPIAVSSGQVEYETRHLKGKLKIRDLNKYKEFASTKVFDIHPLFVIVEGDVEAWERKI